MKLLKCVLVGVMLSYGAMAQTPDASRTSLPQNQAFNNSSSDYNNHAVSVVQRFSFDTFNPRDLIGFYNLYKFNTPGYSWGNAGGWSVQHGVSENGFFNTRGIGQMYVSNSVKHATGDFAAQYIYSSTDGGATAQSDEGFTLDTREGGESDRWFHGTAGAGAVPGVTVLPVSYVTGPQSQETTTDGAFMLDITKGTISGVVTGPETLVEGTSVHVMPVSAMLPPSTGIGIVDTPLPRIKEPTVPETITLTAVRLIRGSFVIGKACLAGGWYPEQVVVTKVSPASHGLQDVTVIHKNPNGKDANNPTSLWQGGVCGQYMSLDRNLARDGFRTSYEIVGATDSQHLAYIWNVKGGTKQDVIRVYTPPTMLTNLSRSNGVVTAKFARGLGPYILNHAASVVITGASAPSFNGTVHLPEFENDVNHALKWSQAGTDDTSSTASIDLPPSYYGFHLYPGAEVLGPQNADGVPLESNSVEWASGDVIENPHNPSFTMGAKSTHLAQHTLSNGTNSSGELWDFFGAGISANYYPSVWRNSNPCSLYIGCGGTLEPIRWHTYTGPYRELMSIRSAPLNQGALITIGCDLRGCEHKSPYNLFQLQNGALQYDPADGHFTVSRMTAALFSGNLEGRVTTTQIDLQDPKNRDHVLTITNSNGRVVIGSQIQGNEGVNGSGLAQNPESRILSGATTVVPGPANVGGNASCARGYTCTASRGRLTVIVSAAAGVGTIARVKTVLPGGMICTATQNGGTSFLGIGSGRESAEGFDITASVAPHETLTIDYGCR